MRKFPSGDIERSIGPMRQEICDVRRAATWLAGREAVDAGKLGVAGIRLGGIVAAVTTAVDLATDRALWEAAGRPPIRWYDCGH